jgi:hypothetical protein
MVATVGSGFVENPLDLVSEIEEKYAGFLDEIEEKEGRKVSRKRPRMAMRSAGLRNVPRLWRERSR